MVPSQAGKCLVWDEPQHGHTYTCGVDVAEGKVRDAGMSQRLDELRAERDFSAAYVLEDLTGDIVCAYHSNVNPHVVAEDLLPLALWYNQATMAIEVTGTGRGTQDALQRWGYRRFYLPLRRELLAPDFGDEPQPGFQTTNTTRPLMIRLMHEFLAESPAKIRDLNLVKELKTIERDKTGKARGIGRNKDDRAMAFMIANYVRCEKLHADEERASQDPRAHLPPGDRHVWEVWEKLTSPTRRNRRDSDPDEELFRA